MAVRTGASQLIQRTAGVCGGEACIRDLRIPVWLLVQAKRLGATDQDILAGYPDLTQKDLVSAWRYERLHAREISDLIALNEPA